MATLLVVVNLVGFAPSYFLKGLFDTPVLPLRVHIHGALFTFWFLLFLVQTSLIASRQVRLHRAVGVAGAVLACSMVASGLTLLYYRTMQYHEFGGDLAVTAGLVWANLALLIAFATFVSLALAFRHRPEAHKRLMLLASLSMIGQALGRLGRFEALRLGDSPFVNEGPYALGGLALLLGSMFVHDVRRRGRPHPATTLGVPLLFAIIIVAGFIVPFTRIGQALILAFG